jgi:hypothetical protein
VPLVYVHGVATRRGPDPELYDQGVRCRDALFRRFVLPGVVADPARPILSPYWGDDGAQPAWNHASVPVGGAEAFGAEGDAVAEILDDAVGVLPEDRNAPLLTIARRDGLTVAVDVLTAVGLDTATSPSSDGRDSADEVVDLAAGALEVARDDERPPWLADAEDDVDFLNRLRDEIDIRHPAAGGQEAFGFSEAWDRLRESIDRVSDAVPRLVSRGLLNATRQNVQQRVTNFFGDVFVYLKDGSSRQRIGEVVETQLRAAAADRSDGEPLLIVAHSMGGDICYDLLSSNLRDLQVDALVTVGSQVGYFEELKLFTASNDKVRADAQLDRVDPPANVRNWLNVFDRNDPLAFAIEPIFAPPATDFVYSTGKQTLAAHSAYWVRPSFHERLGARLRGLLNP